MDRDLDYAALFREMPAACVVLDRDLVIVGVNLAYLGVTNRSEAELLGRSFFDAFPASPEEADLRGWETHRRSMENVLATGRTDVLALHRYSIPGPAGDFVRRWWNIVNAPVVGADGAVELIVHRVEDVTVYVETGSGPPDGEGVTGSHTDTLQAQLFARTRELQEVNARLREASLRNRDVALSLQESALATPGLAGHPEIAVRYLPAAQGMNVCGDWYDVVDLGSGRLALTVGDVVGHGLAAASVMGMLRSALSAAVRVADGPSGALETLGLYSRSMEAAMSTTTFACQIHPSSRLLTYSSAGHPPPVLMHPDGAHELLDQATDPPLGVRWEHVPRPQANVTYERGDLLVLYTDGLVERRDEDIDVRIGALAAALASVRDLDPSAIADALLDALRPPGGAGDDIALVVARL